MKTSHLMSMVLIATGMALSSITLADTMSKDAYKAEKDRISSDAKMDKEKCKSLAGNAKDICMEEAKGREKTATAVLDARNNPTVKNQYEVRMAKADAAYGVAKERCDDLAGNPKDVCVKEAKAAYTSAKADAKAQEKMGNADAEANKTIAKAEGKANDKAADAVKDANAEKADAAYAVAKEKCDSLAGDAKNRCVTEAKLRFNK